MSNYTKTTDFEAKDSLPTGDAEKIIRGADFETEFDNIATAIATKADTAGPTFTGTVTIPTAAVTTLSLDGTTVTSTAAEINLLDGVTATTAELNLLDGVTATTAELNILDGVTATAVELNTLDGITATTAELNTLDGFTGTYEDLNFAQTLRASGVTGDEFDILDGLTATAVELNILDGATVTTAELNLLDGVTATTAELNILDGVTSTAAELNLVDGSTAGTVVDSKAVVYGAAGEVNATTLQVGGVAITSTPAELNLLDGATVTTDEINILDGVTATAAELNLLDGVTATTAELNILDGVTATAAELNTLDGITSTTAELNILDGVTATAAELNTMDGITATTAELNILDGVTADATELNKLDGVTATTSELNYVDVTTLGVVEASKAVTADANADVLFGDNDKLKFGAGSDLQIYHDGTHSVIEDAGTGNLILQSNGAQVSLQSSTELYLTAANNGAVTAYHNGLAKLATTSTGIDVTGTVTVDGLTVDGTGDLGTIGNGAFNAAAALGFQSDRAFFGYSSSQNALIQSGASKGVAVEVNSDTLDSGTRAALFASNGDISFYEDTGTTAKLFWDASAESLGIGTSSPTRKLTIQDTSAQMSLVSDTNQSSVLNFGDTADDNIGRIEYNNNDNSMQFRTNAFDAVLIDSSGNVGIGTDSPSTILHAKSASPKLLLQDSSQTGRQTQLTQAAGIAKIRSRNNASNGQIVFEGYTASTTSEYMRIDSSGNVGIGTSSPSADLHIEGSAPYLRTKNTSAPTDEKTWDYNAGTDGTFRFRATNDAGNDSNNWMVVDRSGVDINYIAMSTGNQSEAMRITNAGDVEVKSGGKLQANRADNARNIQLFNDSDFGTIQTSNDPIKIASQAYTRFDVGGTERLRIDASGNLLVSGTEANPAQNNTTDAISLHNAGLLRASTTNAAAPLDLNVKSRDGDIATFRKDGTLVGSIGVQPSSNLFIGGGLGDGAGIRMNSGAVFPCDKAGNNESQTKDLGQHGSYWKDFYLSGAIQFGTNSSANALDDYEEGTFTPAASNAQGFTLGTPTGASGQYTKVGQLVTVECGFTSLDSTETVVAGDRFEVGSLPFAPSGNYTAATASAGSCVIYASYGTGVIATGTVTHSGSNIVVIINNAFGSVTFATDVNIAISYITTA